MTRLTPIFSWLHISDIHIGHGGATEQWDQRAVLKALAEDARLLPGEIDIPRPNFIFVTGDLAFSGGLRSPEEYREATTWLDSLCKWFNLERQRVFFVPGNHDVQRDVAAPLEKRAWLDSLRNGGPLDIDGARESPLVDSFLQERFANFKSFAQEYNPLCASPFGWSADFLRSTEGHIEALAPDDDAPGFPMRFVGLNTAILSQDNEDKEKLRVDARTVAEVQLRDARTRFSLVLTHHPLSWLAPRERDRLGPELRTACVHLCGHVHEADTDQHRRGWEVPHGLITVVAGAAHGDNPREVGGIRLPAGHGYNFGMLARTPDTLKLITWPRRWSDQQRAFVPHSDILPRNSLCHEFALSPHLLSRLPPHRTATTKLPEGRLSFEDWHAFVPKRVFLASEEGFSRPLIDQFEQHLEISERYFYKGATARATSVQLLKWLGEPERRVHEMRFLLALPRVDVMKQRGMAEHLDAAQVSKPEFYQNMIDESFITLVGLNSMRTKLRRSETIEVGFFSEEPYDRTEILDKGLYLTYYRLGGKYGTTLYYYKDSLIYEALKGYFNLTLQASRYRIRFSRESVRVEGLPDPRPATLDGFIQDFDEQHRSSAEFESRWLARIKELKGKVWAT